MGMFNLFVTVAVIGGLALFMKSDARQAATFLKRNTRSVRSSLEEEAQVGRSKIKEVDSPASEKSSSKVEKE